MRRFTFVLALVLFLCVNPASAVDPNASVVQLRKNCAGIGDCFTSFVGITLWLWGGSPAPRATPPSETDRVLVEIGPGVFSYSQDPTCNSRLVRIPGDPPVREFAINGFVTFRGAGRDRTILRRTFNGPGDDSFVAGFQSIGCDGLEFHDLTIESPQYATIFRGGGWLDQGDDGTRARTTSLWRNVDLRATGDDGRTPNASAWTEERCHDEPGTTMGVVKGLHYFFDSRLIVEVGDFANNAFAYRASCAETWFFGGEIAVEATDETKHGVNFTALEISNNGDVRAFGTRIRSDTRGAAGLSGLNANVPGGVGPIGVLVGQQLDSIRPGGVLHLHGSSIEVYGGANALDASALVVTDGAVLAHTPGSSFEVEVAPAQVPQRVVRACFGPANPGCTPADPSALAESPFQWPAGASPPGSTTEANVLESVEGKDLFVETDRSCAGSCNPGEDGNRAHLMIYNPTSCPSTGWRDVVTGACR